METKFTKGPWVADVRAGYCAVYKNESRDERGQGLHNDDENIYYANYPNVTVEGYTYQSEEATANAHLIAAAPEMYKMLESVSKELYLLIDEVNDQRLSKVNSQTETPPDLHEWEALHLIQCLLAKARGEDV